MAKTITMVDVLEDVRAQFEIRAISLSDVILTRWANDSLALLWDHLISVNPDLVLKSTTLSVTSGTDSYDLSELIADFYKGQGIAVLGDDGRYFPLGTFPLENRYLYADTVSSRRDQLYRYMDKYLLLAPVPAWSGTLSVFYCPVAPTLHCGILPVAATTASTQATGTGATALRVNLPAATVYVNGKRKDFVAEADRLIHSTTLYTGVDGTTLAAGKSAIVSIVAKSSSATAGQGTISLVNVKGGTATTGAEVAPTAAQMQTAVGAGLPYVELGRVTVARTGDTTLSLTYEATPNSVDLFNSWNQFMVAETAWRCAIKEGDPTVRDLLNRRDKLLGEIKSFAPQRELVHNDTVRDIHMRGEAAHNPFARLPDAR